MRRLNVSLVFALTSKQYLFQTSVNRGSSAQDLIEASGFMHELAELNGKDISEFELGVYSEKISSNYLLEDGDRVEIYRRLRADPKVVRRQLALLGKTMGKR